MCLVRVGFHSDSSLEELTGLIVKPVLVRLVTKYRISKYELMCRVLAVLTAVSEFND